MMGINFSQKQCILIIILLGAFVFANSLFNQFVLDDPAQITANPLIQSLENIPSFFTGSTFTSGSNLVGAYYKPLMTTAFAFLWAVFGPAPFPFHLLQICLHITNSVLLFYLLQKFFVKQLSLALALIFLVHPINSEAVIYISNLQDTLFFFFGLLSLLVITTDKMQKSKQLILFALFSFLSLASKETGVLFLLLALVYKFLLEQKPKNLSRFIGVSAGILVLYLVLRWQAVGLSTTADNIFPIGRADFAHRVLTMPKIVFYYLKTALFPFNLAVGQQWIVKSVNWPDFFLPLLFDILFFLSLCLAVVWRWKKKRELKTLLFFCIWLVLGLFIHLQIIPLDATVADRWFYFSLVGFLGIGCVLLESLVLKHIRLFGVIFAILLIFFSARTIIRNSNWKNGLTLAQHDTQITTDSFVLENNYGFELIQAGRFTEAQEHLQKSIDLAPYWWLNWNNLGVVYRHQGVANNDPQLISQAENSFKKATENTDTFSTPYENLAETLFNFSSPGQAKQFILDTSTKMQLTSQLWYLLAIADYKQGNKDQALKEAQTALFLNPQDAQTQALREALISGKTINIQTPAY